MIQLLLAIFCFFLPNKFSLILEPFNYLAILSTLLLPISFVKTRQFRKKNAIEILAKICLNTCIFFIVCILFGVQLKSFKVTLMFSFYLSVLLLPYGPLGPIVESTLVATWVGSFVIPLDWNTKWQVWPIPNVFCSFVGFFLGFLYSLK